MIRRTKTPAASSKPQTARLVPVELDDARLDAVAGGIVEPVCSPYAPRGIKDGTSNTGR